MNILLVHGDKFPWAATHRAKALKKEWLKDKVDIVNYSNLPYDGGEHDVIHFLYSGGISKVKDYILRYKDKTFTTLASHRTLDLFFDKLEPLIEIYKNSVCCVCHNNDLADKLKKIIKQDNVVCIPNGVDEKMFNRKFVVGCVSARQDYRDYKGLNLVKQACEDLELELRITSNIPYELMPNFYREIDCLVIASLNEGCNNPTLEALAMNKPVISTRVGIADQLEGVIIVERNVESIKKALRKVSGRIQILEKYTWKKIAAQYRKLYGLEK